MKKVAFIVFAAFLLVPVPGNAESRVGYINFGPMIHLNSRNNEIEISYGFEISYWSFARIAEEDINWFFPATMDLEKPAYGLDVGVDFGKGKLRFYAEPQVQQNLFGLSMGGVLEKREGEAGLLPGFQTSAWSYYFPFVNMRYRLVSREHYVSPGLYFKPGGIISGE